ncbi:MAG: ankyrin repeat domain-containing protein [Candidatus Vogelbacteria bacterium]|nr:ankyrin repeat domain-containing protein [Candidatus Vogelbacteria bacterium]
MKALRWFVYDAKLRMSSFWHLVFPLFGRSPKPEYDTHGWAPLHRAVMKSDLGSVKRLLSTGSDPNVRSRRGELTSLHLAAQLGDEQLCLALLEAGANPNIPEYVDGLTPLYHAIEAGSAETVGLLLCFGADARIRTRWGNNILEWEKAMTDNEIIQDFLYDVLGWRAYLMAIDGD